MVQGIINSNLATVHSVHPPNICLYRYSTLLYMYRHCQCVCTPILISLSPAQAATTPSPPFQHWLLALWLPSALSACGPEGTPHSYVLHGLLHQLPGMEQSTGCACLHSLFLAKSCTIPCSVLVLLPRPIS